MITFEWIRPIFINNSKAMDIEYGEEMVGYLSYGIMDGPSDTNKDTIIGDKNLTQGHPFTVDKPLWPKEIYE